MKAFSNIPYSTWAIHDYFRLMFAFNMVKGVEAYNADTRRYSFNWLSRAGAFRLLPTNPATRVERMA